MTHEQKNLLAKSKCIQSELYECTWLFLRCLKRQKQISGRIRRANCFRDGVKMCRTNPTFQSLVSAHIEISRLLTQMQHGNFEEEKLATAICRQSQKNIQIIYSQFIHPILYGYQKSWTA